MQKTCEWQLFHFELTLNVKSWSCLKWKLKWKFLHDHVYLWWELRPRRTFDRCKGTGVGFTRASPQIYTVCFFIPLKFFLFIIIVLKWTEISSQSGHPWRPRGRISPFYSPSSPANCLWVSEDVIRSSVYTILDGTKKSMILILPPHPTFAFYRFNWCSKLGDAFRSQKIFD